MKDLRKDMWSWVRLTKNQVTTRPDHLWPEMWSSMSQAAQRKEKQQWAIDKPKIDNARKLKGIYFTDPDDGEFKATVNNARRKLEIPMEAAMPCELRTTKRPNKAARNTRRNQRSQQKQENKTCMHRGGS